MSYVLNFETLQRLNFIPNAFDKMVVSATYEIKNQAGNDQVLITALANGEYLVTLPEDLLIHSELLELSKFSFEDGKYTLHAHENSESGLRYTIKALFRFFNIGEYVVNLGIERIIANAKDGVLSTFYEAVDGLPSVEITTQNYAIHIEIPGIQMKCKDL